MIGEDPGAVRGDGEPDPLIDSSADNTPDPVLLGDLPDPLTDRVAFLLQLAVARAQAMGEESLLDLGIVGREYGVLALLGAGASSAQHRIGATLGIDRTSIAKLLAGLAAKGLVSRRTDPANRRAYLVALTPAGEDLRARAARLLADCEEEFLSPLGPTARDRLRTDLRDLIGEADAP